MGQIIFMHGQSRLGSVVKIPLYHNLKRNKQTPLGFSLSNVLGVNVYFLNENILTWKKAKRNTDLATK